MELEVIILWAFLAGQKTALLGGDSLFFPCGPHVAGVCREGRTTPVRKHSRQEPA
ncbi:Hypothetical predicted protein, partial [Marmota monax]